MANVTVKGTRDGNIELSVVLTADWGSPGNVSVTTALYNVDSDANGARPLGTATSQLGPNQPSQLVQINPSNTKMALSGTLCLQGSSVWMQGLSATNPGFVQILSPNLLVAVTS